MPDPPVYLMLVKEVLGTISSSDSNTSNDPVIVFSNSLFIMFPMTTAATLDGIPKLGELTNLMLLLPDKKFPVLFLI